MSSTYTLYPPAVPDVTGTHRDLVDQPRSLPAGDTQHHISPSTPAYRGHPTAFSPQYGSSSVSPAVNTNTPAESESTLNTYYYQSSEFSESEDPFFGVDFNTLDGVSPSFLSDDILPPEDGEALTHQPATESAPTNTQHVSQASTYLPLSPGKSPSMATGSPNPQKAGDGVVRSGFPDLARTSAEPGELSVLTQSYATLDSHASGIRLTPRTSDSGQSSDDVLAPSAAAMQSPRVTVSHWDKNREGFPHALDAEHQEHGDVVFSAARDDAGRWLPDHVTGHAGLDPSVRSAAEVRSINDLASERKLGERNREVDDWLERSAALSPSNPHAGEQPADAPNDGDDNIPQRDIALGHQTENKPVPGQTYYVEKGGELTREDLELMRQGRNWEDAPLPFPISGPDSTAHQPPTSEAAMEKFQRMCRDNDSIVSRAATWGTRRLSLPSIIDAVDAEVQAAGNFLKKLSLSRGENRRPSILEGLRDLVRRPSVNLNKRSRNEHDDARSFVTDASAERKETQAKLAPPSPKPGWTRKQAVPSINTAFVAVGSRAASIGSTHARAGSISATTPIASPKSPTSRNLSVRKPLNRLRSKSETSSIVDLWKKSGGPPVANVGTSKVEIPEADDDEDDEDDLLEDGETKSEINKLIDDITPNFAGFRQHVLKLNPLLGTRNNYLVDRIAHQQCVRYKGLLNFRLKHVQAIAAENCPCGSMCVALGGSPNLLDSKGDLRDADPLSARFDGSDGDITPLEGVINQESFPPDIPMPPTTILPAEFECQLCFTAKKFQKPSDWTKHVHEDVQPFTCTWERCKEHKTFKRKADWVRHENEGHRHLEWWTCDVEDCRHVCYRRDNFLQHLVREHKFMEPKVKTKAAIKRAGAVDPTWAKVEQCHYETPAVPQSEPCRFCGKTFPSWKKLTVHLAKHMEQISLPILKLVAKKELDEDTIISPVQEPPPRSFPATFTATAEQQSLGPSPTRTQPPLARQPAPMAYPTSAAQVQSLMYPIGPPPGYPAGLYGPNFEELSQAMTQAAQAQMAIPPAGHHPGFQSLSTQAAFPSLPATSAAYMTAPAPPPSSYASMGPGVEPFPALSMDALGLGLQDPSGGAPVPMPYGGGAGMDAHLHSDAGLSMPLEQQQFTPQGSVSPYGRSPHQPQGAFY